MAGWLAILVFLGPLSASLTTVLKLVPSALFLYLAMFRPERLSRLRQGWIHLGNLIGKFTHTPVLGMLFFCVITPLGILRRCLGFSQLNLSEHSEEQKDGRSTYWLPVDKGLKGDLESLRKQF